jgi:4-aminobutyrate aminotransferase
MVGRGGLYGNVLRLSPPLNIGRADVDEFIVRLDAAFAKVEAALFAGVTG